jgi:hypothetical protein
MSKCAQHGLLAQVLKQSKCFTGTGTKVQILSPNADTFTTLMNNCAQLGLLAQVRSSLALLVQKHKY